MSTVCFISLKFINPKKLLLVVFVSAGLFITNVHADNAVSCDSANGAIENTAITATTANLTDNNDGTISDSETGLIWKKCKEDQVWFSTFLAASNVCIDTDLSDPGTYNWQAALQRAQDVNAGTGQNFSQTDWRLPNIKELGSIVEFRCSNPAINNTVFPSLALSNLLWSSSLYQSPNNGGFAWGLSALGGNYSVSNKNGDGYVRLVRSGQ